MVSRRGFLIGGAVGIGSILLNPRRVFGEDTQNHSIRLTIDDGPRKWMPAILNCLKDNNFATFFVVGCSLKNRENYSIVLEALQRGNQIGNHSYSHPIFSSIGLERIRGEIERTDELIEKLYQGAGRKNPKIFRFPYLNEGGRKAPAVKEILDDLGYTIFGFDVGTFDYKHYLKEDKKSKNFVMKNVAKAVGGDIVLMHDLPIAVDIIRFYRREGFRLDILVDEKYHNKVY